MSLNMKALAMCVPLTLVACSNTVPEDGFKQFKYGMTLAELKQQGFECDPDDVFCSRELSDDRRNKETLFGHPASVDVVTEKGKLTSLNVSIDIPAKELESQVTNEFGSPETFDYATFGGGRATQLIWPASNGTSLSMVRAANDSSGLSASSGSLHYNSGTETAELKKRQKNAGVKAGDF